MIILLVLVLVVELIIIMIAGSDISAGAHGLPSVTCRPPSTSAAHFIHVRQADQSRSHPNIWQ